VPPVADSSDKITITGTKEGIEKAMHEIRVTSDEQVIKVKQDRKEWDFFLNILFPVENSKVALLDAEQFMVLD
jgi:malonyl CoA-acyl carrier protein transacylase